MCINPGKLRDGTRIACRLCWQCRENRVNDWVGRCIAESQTAMAWNMVTLTYGPDVDGNEDHPRAKVLTFSDVQKYIRLLKRHGYPCRYVAAGEYGAMKGRAHWHLILFWLDKVPPHKLDVRFDEPHWPHGVSYFERPSDSAVRYVCKYIQKDVSDDEWQGHFSMSKYPPLGTVYFEREAERYALEGLAPQDLFYSFPDVLDKRGRKIKFLLKGATADRFLSHFVKCWSEVHPGRELPNSELVRQFLDPEIAPRFAGNGREVVPVHNERLSDLAAGENKYWRDLREKAQAKEPRENLDPGEWVILERFNRAPRDNDLASWMSQKEIWWDNNAGAWVHPARLSDALLAGDPWEATPKARYYFHYDFVKESGSWRVVPPVDPRVQGVA